MLGSGIRGSDSPKEVDLYHKHRQVTLGWDNVGKEGGGAPSSFHNIYIFSCLSTSNFFFSDIFPSFFSSSYSFSELGHAFSSVSLDLYVNQLNSTIMVPALWCDLLLPGSHQGLTSQWDVSILVFHACDGGVQPLFLLLSAEETDVSNPLLMT